MYCAEVTSNLSDSEVVTGQSFSHVLFCAGVELLAQPTPKNSWTDSKVLRTTITTRDISLHLYRNSDRPYRRFRETTDLLPSNMVELVEVEDESFENKQAGPEENDDDYYTDTGAQSP